MSRSVKEWIAKTDDEPVPRRVRTRVLEKFSFRCDPAHGCGRPIRAGDKWTCDHIKALINGGENRERNLHSQCDWCTKWKNRADVAEKSKTYRVRAAHYGVRQTRRNVIKGWRRFDGTPVRNPKLIQT